MNYYFEPTSSFLTSDMVAFRIGEVALAYDYDRKASIGLYPAYEDYGVPYNPFRYTPNGFIWQKFTDGAELLAYDSSLFDRISSQADLLDLPFYVQLWDFVPLTGSNQVSAFDDAVSIVNSEVNARLSEVTVEFLKGMRQGVNFSTELSTYVSDLLSIDSAPGFPEDLAYSVRNQSFTSWPTRPSIFLNPSDSTLPIDAYTRSEVDSMVGGDMTRVVEAPGNCTLSLATERYFNISVSKSSGGTLNLTNLPTDTSKVVDIQVELRFTGEGTQSLSFGNTVDWSTSIIKSTTIPAALSNSNSWFLHIRVVPAVQRAYVLTALAV